MSEVILLVVAKAPVAGLAKTRMAKEIGDVAAARLAAAALLDTMDAVLAVPDTMPVVAMTGELAAAERADEVAAALSCGTVIPQRGEAFADRLANAHADAAEEFPGRPVLQICMDTPQLRPEMLTGAIVRLLDDGTDAVLGPATDGGWWSLGLRDPADAHVLRTVPMSRSDTGNRTLFALRGIDLRVVRLPTLSDVDTMADAVRIAAVAPRSQFGQAFAELGYRRPR